MRTIVFLGQKRYFLAAAFEGSLLDVTGFFIDLDVQTQSRESLLVKINNLKPDLIVFFRPDFFPEVVSDISSLGIAPLVGFFTEPVTKRTFGYGDNLRDRRKQLSTVLPKLKIDYTVCYSIELADYVSRFCTVNLVMPLPVNDSLFRNHDFKTPESRPLFVGRLNLYRSEILNDIKHEYNPLIIENGLDYFTLKSIFPKQSFISLNIHVAEINTFEHRVLVDMAMGNLVLSQSLTPDFGILPDCEYLLFSGPQELRDLLKKVYSNPDWANWVASRGNQMSARHRSSEVWSRLLDSKRLWEISK